MKILQVFNRYHEKGGEELFVERASSMLREQHQVFDCYFDSRTWVETKQLGERALHALQMLYNPESVREFRRQLDACNPDIIILHNVFPVGSIGIYLEALKSGVPVCQYIHNFRPYSVNGYLWANEKLETAGLRKNFLPEILAGAWQNSRLKTAIYACVLWQMHATGIYRKLDGWLAISEFMHGVFVKAGVPAEKVFLLRHSWESSDGNATPTASLPDANSTPYFLFLGRITEAKGIKILLAAWKEVEARHADARLVIGGDGPAAEWLRTAVTEHPRVDFKGFVTGEEKRALLQNCRAMVVPSEWWEPLGLVVYEAYQFGRPVIAAASGGLLETVMDGRTGWIYQPGDPAALARCIFETLDRPEEADRRGQEGLQWMAAHSRNADWLREFEAIATEVLRRRGLGRAASAADQPDQPVCFSIVTASFRQVDYLKKCAASVADQGGGFVVEHLVQDGISGAEFDAWAQGQTFASCVSEKDEGMYDAINRGFRRAKGEFVAWLNCDEQYLPGTLATVKAWFEKNPGVDILFGDIVLVTPGGVPLAYRKAIKPISGHIRNCFLATYSAATFVRRKVIDQGFLIDTNYRAIADGVWIDSLLAAGFKTGVLNQPLAIFTQTGCNLGQGDVAHRENLAWRKNLGKFQPLRRQFWSLAHRCRKLLAGAYQTRNVGIRIFGQDHEQRSVFRARVGERWVTIGQVPAAGQKAELRVAVYLADQNPNTGRSMGISRMTEVLLGELERHDHAKILAISSRSSLQPPANSSTPVRFPWTTRNQFLRILTDHCHPLLSWRMIHADVWYFPKGFLPRFQWLCTPSAVTIHDTIIQYYSDHYPKWRTDTEYRYWADMLKHTIRHAHAILTVSESAKAQILAFMERHRLPIKDIHVTYEPCLYETIPQPVHPQKNHHVLHLGSREPHKRTAWLIRQWLAEGVRNPDLPELHVVGTIPPEVGDLALESPKIVCLPFLEDEALRYEFSSARALILPSEIEGFGLPAIEAYYLGTPVCYNRGTSVEEILAPATSRGEFSLEDPASLFAALDEVTGISPEEVRACGLKLRETYAADKVTEKILTVFERLKSQFGN